MKAYRLTGLRRMELQEVAEPRITAPDEVLIRMRSVGVCGSDIHYYRTGRIGSQVVRYPFTLGHEGAGEVVAVGEGVTRVHVGDRIAIDPAMPCGVCDQCLAGRPHTCRNLRFLGTPGQAEGCLSEYIVLPEGSCYPLPEGVAWEEAAFVEPLSIGVYAVRLAGEMQGKTVAILGSGPIGMSVLLPARSYGAERIYMTDKIDERLALARRSGAAWTGNPQKEDVVKGILEQEPLGVDRVFECCGQQEAVDQAIRLLKPGGTLLIIGIPEQDTWTFPVDDLRHKEITVRNVRRQNDAVQEAIDLVADGRVKVKPLITHHFPFEKVPEAFDLVEGYRDGVMKAVIQM